MTGQRGQRVLQLTLHSGSGGAESVAKTLDAALRSHDLHIETQPISPHLDSNLALARERFGGVRRVLRTRSIVRRAKPDVILAHGTLVGLYSRIATLLGPRPPVLQVQHSAGRDLDYLALRLAEKALGVVRPCHLRGVSPAHVEEFGVHGVRTLSTGIVRNPVPASFFVLDRAPASPAQILMLGRVAPQKDYAAALQLMAIVIKHRPDARLLVAGQIVDAGHHGDLRRLAARLNITGSVDWLGQVEVRPLLATATLLLHTAEREAQPMAVLEAMAANLPVVVRDAAVRGTLIPTEALRVFDGVQAGAAEVLRILAGGSVQPGRPEVLPWTAERVVADYRALLLQLIVHHR